MFLLQISESDLYNLYDNLRINVHAYLNGRLTEVLLVYGLLASNKRQHQCFHDILSYIENDSDLSSAGLERRPDQEYQYTRLPVSIAELRTPACCSQLAQRERQTSLPLNQKRQLLMRQRHKNKPAKRRICP